MSEPIILDKLPKEHELRNKPLGQLNAEIRSEGSTKWRAVATWKIAGSTYNELSGLWTVGCEWRVQE